MMNPQTWKTETKMQLQTETQNTWQQMVGFEEIFQKAIINIIKKQ